MDFSGRTVVVTGAASGMGKATAMGFGGAGANVALFDLDEGGAKQVAENIDPTGARAVVYPVDMATPSVVQEALQAVYERYSRLDAVANVAAIFPPTNPDVNAANALEVTEEYWDRMLSVNLRGVFFCCQAAIRIMIAEGWGAIVNVASGAAFRPIQGLATYSASKAGVVGMSRVLALECAEGCTSQRNGPRSYLDRGQPQVRVDRGVGCVCGDTRSRASHDSGGTGERDHVALLG